VFTVISPSATQRGGATLIVLMVLCLTLALLMATAHRHTLFAQHGSVQHQQSATAFEAAEAGLDWTLAQLNRTLAINDQCSTASAAFPQRNNFRQRYAATTAQPSCTAHSPGIWSCQCPETTQARPAAVAVAPDALATFSVALQNGQYPQWINLTSTGCSGPTTTADCTTDPQSVSAHSHLSIGHISALAALPQGALSTAPEPPTPTTPRSRFMDFFHMDQVAWKNQPAVHQLSCEVACDTQLDHLVGYPTQAAMLWLSGGLHLQSKLTLGSAEHPVLLIVDGPIHFESPVRIYGLLYTTSAQWQDAPSGSHIHGAVVAQGALQRRGGPTQLHFDPALLSLLSQQNGTYAKVPGSWHDGPK
jgi:Tfp pilus assembly protein PilX